MWRGANVICFLNHFSMYQIWPVYLQIIVRSHCVRLGSKFWQCFIVVVFFSFILFPLKPKLFWWCITFFKYLCIFCIRFWAMCSRRIEDTQQYKAAKVDLPYLTICGFSFSSSAGQPWSPSFLSSQGLICRYHRLIWWDLLPKD